MRCEYWEQKICSSCTAIDIPYETQVEAKNTRTQKMLSNFPDIDWLDPVTSTHTGFRNKAKLVIGGTYEKPTLGILDKDFNGVDVTNCPLYEPALRAIFPVLRTFIRRAMLTPFDVKTGRGELKHIIVTVSPDGVFLVRFILRSTESEVRIRKHLTWLLERIGTQSVVTLNILPYRAAIIEGETEWVLTKHSELLINMGELSLALPPRSFFQTNTRVARELYAQAREWVEQIAREAPVGESVKVWDLYCGVGGFALSVAGKGREVLGVEISEEAIQAARDSAQRLGIQARFVVGDAEASAYAHPHPDVLIVNPPRRGIGRLAEWVNGSGAKWVIYSSCNPESLARDLSTMDAYSPLRARVFDMFPHTYHTETCVLLKHAF